MPKYQMSGVFKPYIEKFVELKHLLGFRADSMELSLNAFDRLTRVKGITKVIITESLSKEWCEKRPGEKNDTWSHRINFLRQFCIYLHNMGFDVFIPPKPPIKKDAEFVPYIYTDKEKRDIFTAVDSLRLFDNRYSSNLFIMPALVRLLFATGIRIGEALALKDEDVNLDSGFLVIKKSKNGKERIVPFADSLTRVFTQYVSYRNKLPFRRSDNFFVKPNGDKASSSSINLWWHKILKKANIPLRGAIPGPRLHDARHCFCVGSIRKMAMNGNDLYYSLPVLSRYIGHSSIASTDRYVRMTSEMYPDILEKTDSILTYIFSK